MTKFANAEDPGFGLVSNELWMWVQDLDKRRNTAELQTASMPPNLLPEQLQQLLEASKADHSSRNYFQGTMSNIGQLYQGNNNVQYNGS